VITKSKSERGKSRKSPPKGRSRDDRQNAGAAPRKGRVVHRDAKPAESSRPLPPDFVGLVDDRGEVLVDDTAYFRIQREEQPIRDWLDNDKVVRQRRRELAAARERGERTAHLETWLEQAMISSFAAMLREVRKRAQER
jgi:hypothetical protein